METRPGLPEAAPLGLSLAIDEPPPAKQDATRGVTLQKQSFCIEMPTTTNPTTHPRPHLPQSTHPTTPTCRPWLQLFHARGFVTRHYLAHLPDLPPDLEGLRILHLSDLHIKRKWSSAYDRLLQQVEDHPYDLVLITGDVVDDKQDHRPALPHVRKLLPRLRTRLGAWAILGNHDNLQLGAELESLGIPVLQGKRQLVQTGNASLELIGVHGPYREHLPANFPQQFAPPQPHIPRIILAHYPDHFPRLQEMGPDIYLCGHTHGGQVCLPNGFPIMRHDQSSRSLCRGAHLRGKTHYIVNHGFGFSGLPIRMFCPAEVVSLTLTRHH